MSKVPPLVEGESALWCPAWMGKAGPLRVALNSKPSQRPKKPALLKVGVYVCM